MSLFALGESVEAKCSRAGCREPASWNVNWRNPRIHTEDRIKIWLACDEHRDYLRDYLASRDFPVTVTSFSDGLAEGR
jgi:hypothetical protein